MLLKTGKQLIRIFTNRIAEALILAFAFLPALWLAQEAEAGTAALEAAPDFILLSAMEDNLREMQGHTREIQKAAKEYGSVKLEARLKEAEGYCNGAESCITSFKMVMQTQTDSAPDVTAGIGGFISDENTTRYWYSGFMHLYNGCMGLSAEPDIFHGYCDVPAVRKHIVNTALDAEGKIPYVWGGKPGSPGWDGAWDPGGSGLDCSGFVQWVYWTADGTGEANEGLYSTYAIAANMEKVPYGELLPGDLGMIYDGGTWYTDANGNVFYSYEEAEASNRRIAEEAGDGGGSVSAGSLHVTTHSNHVGIYVGKDDDGDDIWCHCTGGSTRTVTVGEYDGFRYYYRVITQ